MAPVSQENVLEVSIDQKIVEAQNIIKEAISSFQTGISYRTVQKVENQNQTVIKHLPPRLTFITASVAGQR